MDRRGFFGALTVGTAGIVLPTSASAQELPRRPVLIAGNIDLPSPYLSHPYDPAFYIAGWCVDVVEGQQPPFVAVLHHDLSRQTARWITSFLVERGLPRPDVRDYLAQFYPSIQDNMAFGYHVYPNAGLLPSGMHFFAVFWTTGDGISQSNSVAMEVP
jgi:hypothetical protein